jgi:hypothetical protein
MLFVRPNFDDPVARGLDLYAAVVVAEDTRGSVPFRHAFSPFEWNHFEKLATRTEDKDLLTVS